MSNKTFSYLLAATAIDQELEKDLTEYYWGGVLEAFWELEEQAVTQDELWPFGWDRCMSRIAVVQVTQDWDPRPELLRHFEVHALEPTFRQSLSGEQDHILYFQALPNLAFKFAQSSTNPDHLRFQAVLNQTLALGRQKSCGLLFVGGYGFSYEIDPEMTSCLTDLGFDYVNRHA